MGKMANLTLQIQLWEVKSAIFYLLNKLITENIRSYPHRYYWWLQLHLRPP